MKNAILSAILLSCLLLSACSVRTPEAVPADPTPDAAVSLATSVPDTHPVRLKVKEAYDEFFYIGEDLADGYEYVYDDRGQLKQVIDCREPEETNFKYMYDYFDNGALRSCQRYECISDQYTLQQELKFDEKGLIYEQVSYSGGLQNRTPDYNYYTYDDRGNLIRDEHYYDPEELDSVHSYCYDEKGILTESTYTRYRNFAGHSLFYYNEYGYPVVRVEYDSSMELENLYLFSYEYEDSHLATQVTVYKEGISRNIQALMQSDAFPFIDLSDNAAGVRYRQKDPLHVKVFAYETLPMSELQETILQAKKKAWIDIRLWGYRFDGDLGQVFW